MGRRDVLAVCGVECARDGVYCSINDAMCELQLFGGGHLRFFHLCVQRQIDKGVTHTWCPRDALLEPRTHARAQ